MKLNSYEIEIIKAIGDNIYLSPKGAGDFAVYEFLYEKGYINNFHKLTTKGNKVYEEIKNEKISS